MYKPSRSKQILAATASPNLVPSGEVRMNMIGDTCTGIIHKNRETQKKMGWDDGKIQKSLGKSIDYSNTDIYIYVLWIIIV